MRWWSVLRRHPAFFRLWIAECISLVGDWFSVVAISVLAATRGGGEGALAVATTLAAYELPMAAVRPIAGVLADRFDRRSLLIAVHNPSVWCRGHREVPGRRPSESWPTGTCHCWVVARFIPLVRSAR